MGAVAAMSDVSMGAPAAVSERAAPRDPAARINKIKTENFYKLIL
jgi:hypothetical protein